MSTEEKPDKRRKYERTSKGKQQKQDENKRTTPSRRKAGGGLKAMEPRTEAFLAAQEPMYKSPEEMEPVIEEYFELCDAAMGYHIDKRTGKEMTFQKAKPYTMAGLCYHLGFCSAEALSDYAAKGPEWHVLYKRVKLRILTQRNEQLIEKTGIPAGIIFDLKNNHGWKDKTETEHNVSDALVELLGAAAARPRLG